MLCDGCPPRRTGTPERRSRLHRAWIEAPAGSLTMASRYYFDFDLNGVRTEDRHGVPLDGDDEAKLEAMKVLCASAMEDAVLVLPLTGQPWRSRVEIRRDGSQTIFRAALTLAAE